MNENLSIYGPPLEMLHTALIETKDMLSTLIFVGAHVHRKDLLNDTPIDSVAISNHKLLKSYSSRI